jgi:alpha,alpha-trehalose phosphorylase (configuration-retaining)
LIRLQVGFRNVVEVDEGGLARLIEDPAQYQATVRPPTWNAFVKIVKEIKTMGTKVAFFSSTPQGGGVALMRHALIRLFKLMGVDAKWYISHESTNEGTYPSQIPRSSASRKIIIISCRGLLPREFA